METYRFLASMKLGHYQMIRRLMRLIDCSVPISDDPENVKWNKTFIKNLIEEKHYSIDPLYTFVSLVWFVDNHDPSVRYRVEYDWVETKVILSYSAAPNGMTRWREIKAWVGG